MSLSNFLHAIGWIFSFLFTIYTIFLASINEDWFKTSSLYKLASNPMNTLIVCIFFGLIAAIAFILSNHIGNEDNDLKIDDIKAKLRNEFAQYSTPPDKTRIKKLIEENGIDFEKLLKGLNRGTDSDQGLKLLLEGNYPGAIEKFKKANKQIDEKSSEENWLTIGNAYFLNEDYNDSSAAYENATKANSQSKFAWINWGTSLYKQGLYDKAITKFEHAYVIDNSDEHNLMNWGTVLCEKGEYDKGINKYEEAIAINPKSCETYFNWGIALGKIGEYEKAIEKYKSAIETCPQHGGAWSNMGWCYEKIGDYKNAIEKYKKSVEIRPEHGKTWSNYGLALARMKKCDEAINCFENSISLNRNSDEFWNRWGWTLSKCDKPIDAIEKYWHSVKLNPKNKGSWINLCSLISANQTLEIANDAYKKAYENIPYTPELLLNWGIHLFINSNIGGSIEKWEEALEIDPKNELVLSNLSLSLAATGKPKEALEKIKFAEEIDPNNAEYLINHGKILAVLGENELANEKFEKAKKLSGLVPEQDIEGGEIKLFLRTVELEDSLLKTFPKKEKDRIGDDAAGKEQEKNSAIISRPYITFEPVKNDKGCYLTIEAAEKTAKISINFEIKNNGVVAANNITFPNQSKVYSKAKIQAIQQLTPIITLVPDDKITLNISISIDYSSQEELAKDLTHLNSKNFDGYNFGCTLIYENELDPNKRYALSVLYIIKMDNIIVLKLKEQSI